MLQVASLAPRLLENSTSLVADFVQSQRHKSGAFIDRNQSPDIYYTVFGLECLKALKQPLSEDKTLSFLQSFEDISNLDLVHLCSLIRCYANLETIQFDTASRDSFEASLKSFRASDGGYNTKQSSDASSTYATFLAYDAFQALGLKIPDINLVKKSLLALKNEDGSFGKDQSAKAGTTPTTAASAMVLHSLGDENLDSTCEWLLRQHCHEGGFKAAPSAPIPDLLSTATALHTLSYLQENLENIKNPCLDYIDTLWTNKGSFHGNWSDDHIDVEYTFYGLLALGHLS